MNQAINFISHAMDEREHMSSPEIPHPVPNKPETNVGRYVTISLMLLVLVLLVVVPFIHMGFDGVSDSIAEKITKSSCKSHEDKFADAMLTVRGGALIILIVSSLYYQMNFGATKQYTTYLGHKEYVWRPVISAVTASLLGMLSTMFIIRSRGHMLSDNWHGVALIGTALAVFEIAKEASGFNRWSKRDEIQRGEGAYYEIDRGDSESMNKLLQHESTNVGDPFVESYTNTCIYMMGAALLYYLAIMFSSTYFGYRSGAYSICNQKFWGNDTASLGSAVKFFGLELLVIASINAIPQLINPLIRRENPSTMNRWMAGGMAVIASITHIMLQYNGTYTYK